MPALSDPNIPLPQVPVNEVPPTLAQLRDRVDPWIIYELRGCLLDQVTSKHQLHGILNTYLEAIFPKNRNFMIIPQALHRYITGPNKVNEELDNLSVSSLGGLHESRILPDAEEGKLCPDFLIVKVIPLPRDTQNREYIPLALVQAEPRSSRDWDALTVSKMNQYMERLAETPNTHSVDRQEGAFQGFLVSGDHQLVRWNIRHLPGHLHPQVAGAVHDPKNILGNDDPLTTDLWRIAASAWNIHAPA